MLCKIFQIFFHHNFKCLASFINAVFCIHKTSVQYTYAKKSPDLQLICFYLIKILCYRQRQHKWKLLFTQLDGVINCRQKNDLWWREGGAEITLPQNVFFIKNVNHKFASPAERFYLHQKSYRPSLLFYRRQSSPRPDVPLDCKLPSQCQSFLLLLSVHHNLCRTKKRSSIISLLMFLAIILISLEQISAEEKKETVINNTSGIKKREENTEGVNIIWYSTHQSSTGLDSIMIPIYSISETHRHYRSSYKASRFFFLRWNAHKNEEKGMKKLRTTAQKPWNNLQSFI